MSRLFLLTGCPASGKTTTAHALLQRFPRGLRISVDDLRDQVVSGQAHPIPNWDDECDRQFNLARAAAAAMARLYLEAGFAVVIEDHLPPEKAERLLSALTDFPTTRVALTADLDIVLTRNATRTNKNFDATLLGEAIPEFHAFGRRAYAAAEGWFLLDNSTLPVEEVVDRILTEGPIVVKLT